MMRMPSKLSWTLNRLRCMSAGEVAHRLGKSVQARVESLGLARQPVPPPSIPASRPDSAWRPSVRQRFTFV